jgi:uncharacterized damage-inducible protein DinB
MKVSDLLNDLFRHMEWADALVWSAVLPNPALVEDRSVRDRLYHLHLVQRAFLHIWRGEQMQFEGTDALRGVELARWGRAYHADVPQFLATIDGSQFDTAVQLPWASQITGLIGTDLTSPSLGETLLQVGLHSTYHRGQINARIRELGGEPPLTDFIAWVWAGKKLPSWPPGTE